MDHEKASPLDIFIEGWGRMGNCWGIGKVMARIHALLFLSTRPLSLEEMSAQLKTSRSNISLNVRALEDLGVVKKVIIPGDRRDYYTAEQSIGRVTRGLAAVKKKRELDPALEVVDRAIAAADRDGAAGDGSPPIDPTRLRSLKGVMEIVGNFFQSFIEGDGVIPDGVAARNDPDRQGG